MLCLYQIQTRCFRKYERAGLGRIRKHCRRIPAFFCSARRDLERFLAGQRRAIACERQHEYRMG